MFIKFSDKTKKIIVKTSKEGVDEDHDDEENTVYLDEALEGEECDDRRIKVLRELNNDKLVRDND